MSSEEDSVNLRRTEFAKWIEETKERFLIVFLALEKAKDTGGMARVLGEFVREIRMNGYLNGVCLAIMEERGNEILEAAVEIIEDTDPVLAANPKWRAGLETRESVLERGALQGFRLAIRGDTNDPEFVRTKRTVELLESQN